MILHLILSFLHHFNFIYLAATAGIGLESAGEAAGAIINSGADDAGEGDGGEADAGDGADDAGDAGEGDGADGSTQAGKEGKAGSKEAQIDWKTVPAEVKSHIQEIAKTNPKLGNLLQNAVYTSQTFLREVPGGLKEIKALKGAIEEVGGIEEIKNIQGVHKALVDEQEALDTQAREGNPIVLDNLIEIAGDGFGKLMPTAMNRWEQRDPLGYQHEMSKLMVGALKEGGVVSDLNMAFSMLKLNTAESIKEGVACLQRVAAWANALNGKAIKPPERPQVDPKIASEQKKIDDQKAQLFNQEFSSEFGSWRNRTIMSEVGKIANGRQLTEYQMNTLGERVINDIKNILTADPDYMKDLRRLYDARDKAELLKFARNRTAKLLPEVTKKAYRQLFSTTSGKKQAVKKAATPAVPAVAAAPVKGWTKVGPDKAPTPDQIDSKKTTFEMKFRKQAFLKDGTKVYWGSHVPA